MNIKIYKKVTFPQKQKKKKNPDEININFIQTHKLTWNIFFRKECRESQNEYLLLFK